MCALPFGQFCIHVQGVMFCLDGLFVSQSNDMRPDPLLCFAIGAGALQGCRQAPVRRNATVKMCGSGGTAGEGTESVWALREPQGIV